MKYARSPVYTLSMRVNYNRLGWFNRFLINAGNAFAFCSTLRVSCHAADTASTAHSDRSVCCWLAAVQVMPNYGSVIWAHLTPSHRNIVTGTMEYGKSKRSDRLTLYISSRARTLHQSKTSNCYRTCCMLACFPLSLRPVRWRRSLKRKRSPATWQVSLSHLFTPAPAGLVALPLSARRGTIPD